MKPRHIALVVALVLAAGLAIFGDKTPSGGDVAEALVRTPTPRASAPAQAGAPAALSRVSAGASTASGAKTAAEPLILRLQPRSELLGDGDALGGPQTAFGSHSWVLPPPPPPPAPPPPPPTAPPLPFAYMGKAVSEGAWEIYLTRGDKTYSVRAKTVIDGVYRVDAIAPPIMTLTYLPLNQVQQLNIGVFD